MSCETGCEVNCETGCEVACETGNTCNNIEADIEDPIVNGYASGIASIKLFIQTNGVWEERSLSSGNITWIDQPYKCHLSYPESTSSPVKIVVTDNAGNVKEIQY